MKQEKAVVDGIEFTLFYCDLCDVRNNKNRFVLRTEQEKPQVFYTVSQLAEHISTAHCDFQPTVDSNVNGKSATVKVKDSDL